MKQKTFATTFSSIADFAAGCDEREIVDLIPEPGKTETRKPDRSPVICPSYPMRALNNPSRQPNQDIPA